MHRGTLQAWKDWVFHLVDGDSTMLFFGSCNSMGIMGLTIQGDSCIIIGNPWLQTTTTMDHDYPPALQTQPNQLRPMWSRLRISCLCISHSPTSCIKIWNPLMSGSQMECRWRIPGQCSAGAAVIRAVIHVPSKTVKMVQCSAGLTSHPVWSMNINEYQWANLS